MRVGLKPQTCSLPNIVERPNGGRYTFYMEYSIETTMLSAQKKKTAYRIADSYFSRREGPVSLAKQQVVAQSTATDANTDRLRALRLAKEASERDSPSPTPIPKPLSHRRTISIKVG